MSCHYQIMFFITIFTLYIPSVTCKTYNWFLRILIIFKYNVYDLNISNDFDFERNHSSQSRGPLIWNNSLTCLVCTLISSLPVQIMFILNLYDHMGLLTLFCYCKNRNIPYTETEEGILGMVNIHNIKLPRVLSILETNLQITTHFVA